MHQEHDTDLVFDIGSSVGKVGFAGDDLPEARFHTAIGNPKYVKTMESVSHRKNFVGEVVTDFQGILDIRYPFNQARVHNWDDMELLLNYCFHECLNVESKDSLLCFLVPPSFSDIDGKKFTEMFFETYETAALKFLHTGRAVLYSSGKLSGLCVNSGAGVTHVDAYYDGVEIESARMRINFGGNDVTSYLQRLLTEQGYHMNTTAEREIVNDVKEVFGIVSSKKHQKTDCNFFDRERNEYYLPDGLCLILDDQGYQCTEALFDPKIVGSPYPSIQKMIEKVIKKSDIDIRSTLLGNIELAGGNTCFHGYENRLYSELCSIFPNNRIRITGGSVPDRKTIPWMGGSLFSSLKYSKHFFMTKEEYQEIGPNRYYFNSGRYNHTFSQTDSQ